MKTAVVRLIIHHLSWRLEQTVRWCLSSNMFGVDSHRRRHYPLRPTSVREWPLAIHHNLCTVGFSVGEMQMTWICIACRRWQVRDGSGRSRAETKWTQVRITLWCLDEMDSRWSEGPRWEGSGHFLRAISYMPLYHNIIPYTQRLHLFVCREERGREYWCRFIGAEQKLYFEKRKRLASFDLLKSVYGDWTLFSQVVQRRARY